MIRLVATRVQEEGTDRNANQPIHNPGKKTKKWIAGAIGKPGALHRQLGIPQNKKIPAKTLAAAAKKGGKLGKRARLAETLRKMH